MDKIAALTGAARALGATGAGIGAGILAEKQIIKNKHNARAKKGWETRRRINGMVKLAEEFKVHKNKPSLLDRIRTAGNAIKKSHNLREAVVGYLWRRAISNSRHSLIPHKQQTKINLPENL